jgi:putative transposase
VPRFHRIENHDRLFFITTNVLRGVAPLNAGERDQIVDGLAAVRTKQSCALFAFVIMPDHVHVILEPGPAGLAAAMHAFKRTTQYDIGCARGQMRPLWQPRYFDNIIRRVRHFWEKLEYIHNNPVAAGLAQHPGGWRWSSYPAYVKGETPVIPVDTISLPTDGDAELWRTPLI